MKSIVRLIIFCVVVFLISTSIALADGNSAFILPTVPSLKSSWQEGKPDMLGRSRSSHSSVIYKDKMYIFGGYNLKTGFSNELRIYDFKTGNWSKGQSDTEAGRGEHSAVVYKDKMYIYGGGSPPNNKMRVYDFKTKVWSAGITNPLDTYGRYDHTAVVYQDKMYIYGGGQSNWARNLYIYDFLTNRWSMGAASPSNLPMHSNHTAVVYNGKMYVYGGQPIEINHDQTNTMLVYDFKKNIWSEGTADSNNKGRYGHSAIVQGNKMYIYGGVDGNTPNYVTNTVRFYDFSTNTWSDDDRMIGLFRSSDHSTVIYANKLYVFGGETAFFNRVISDKLSISPTLN